jgi:hypothetical protein
MCMMTILFASQNDFAMSNINIRYYNVTFALEARR